MKIIEIISINETTEGMQDIVRLSKQVMDWMQSNNALAPGTVVELVDIPGLKATTPEGRTLINATRVIMVSSDRAWPNRNGTVYGDASPFYIDKKGNVQYYSTPYKDAQLSRDVNKGKVLAPLGQDDIYKDYISTKSEFGDKLNIRLNADLRPSDLRDTLAHEMSHNLDTIKGMDTIRDFRNNEEVQKAQERLAQHKQAQAGETVAKTVDGKVIVPNRPPELLDPKEEKRLIGIIKKSAGNLPVDSTRAYMKRRTEVNARLHEAAVYISDMLPSYKPPLDNIRIKSIIDDALYRARIPVAYAEIASDIEFKAAADTFLTPEELKKVYANPDFQQMYKRIFKFMQAEIESGVVGQYQRDWEAKQLKNWESVGKKTFIQRFTDVVIKGLEVAKLAAKTVLHYTHMADAKFTALLAKKLPILAAKGLLKSIPYAGIVIGVAFGIDRLIKGDAPGAGIELVSGVGSLVTAIPATAYQAARDLYGEYYQSPMGGPAPVLEYDMAQDPEGTKQRLDDLSKVIAEQLKAGMQRNRETLKSIDPNLALI